MKVYKMNTHKEKDYLDEFQEAHTKTKTITGLSRRVKKIQDAEMSAEEEKKKKLEEEAKKAAAEKAKQDACGTPEKKKDQLCPICKKEPCVCEPEKKKEDIAPAPSTSETKKEEKKEEPKPDKQKDSMYNGFAFINDGLTLLLKEVKDADALALLKSMTEIRDKLADKIEKK
jgi:glucan-binding YG repeat protein